MLKVHKLTAGYGNLRVIRKISLGIEASEILTIIGANGTGKSTLLGALSGLLRPESGQVFFKGHNITGLSCKRIVALGIGHVLQGIHVFNELTVEDNLVLGAYGQRFNITILKGRHLLRVYKYFPVLEKNQKQFSGSWSGGEKQMLSIGRALMSEPKLLFLDEPSTGLAPLLVKHLFKILNELKKELSLTTLLVEQNAEAALRFADRALVLAQGPIMLEGEAKSLINRKEVQEIYLGKGAINPVK